MVLYCIATVGYQRVEMVVLTEKGPNHSGMDYHAPGDKLLGLCSLMYASSICQSSIINPAVTLFRIRLQNNKQARHGECT